MPSSDPAHEAQTTRRVWLLFLCFCIPLLLGWVLLERQLAKVPNSFSAKRDELQPLAGNVDTVILGSSEAFFGLAAHRFRGTAFNLANSAPTVYYDDEILQRVLPQLPNLKRVILQFDYVSLYSEMYDNQDSWRIYGYYQEWHIPLQRQMDYWNVRLVSRAALYKTLPVLLEMAKGHHANFATCVDDRGWCDVPLDWAVPGMDDDQARGMIAANHSNMHDDHIAANTAVLEHLLATLHARGVETDIVVMPITTYYHSAMQPALWEREQVVVKDLAGKYGARFMSFEQDPRLTDADFNDVNHLNARGAARFSEFLDAELGPLKTGNSDAP